MMMTQEIQRTNLKYKKGTSDKVYQVVMTREKDGYFVTGYNGRRGDTLKERPQNIKPVSREQADKLFNALVKKKRTDRDTPYDLDGEASHHGAHHLPRNGQPSQISTTDLQPQLLTAIEDPSIAIARLTDREYGLQEKYDGKRILLVVEANGSVYPYNRSTGVCAVAESILEDAKKMHNKVGSFILDGESVGSSGFAGGGRFFTFDILSLDGRDLRNEPFLLREQLLRDFGRKRVFNGGAIVRAETAFTPAEKKKMARLLYTSGKEGGVLKSANAKYLPGRRKDQFKLKFTVDSTFVVVEVHNDRASVRLGLFDDKGKLHALGNCSVRDARFRLKEGNVIDVRYLYALRDSRAAYQPRMLRIRDDVGLDACMLSQLYYRGDPRPIDQFKELFGL
jgi:hypothetical protein